MAVLRSRLFGEVQVDGDAYEKRPVVLGGRTLERSLYVGENLADQGKLGGSTNARARPSPRISPTARPSPTTSTSIFSVVVDYGFSRPHSDQLLAVKLDEAGTVLSVSHES